MRSEPIDIALAVDDPRLRDHPRPRRSSSSARSSSASRTSRSAAERLLVGARARHADRRHAAQRRQRRRSLVRHRRLLRLPSDERLRRRRRDRARRRALRAAALHDRRARRATPTGATRTWRGSIAGGSTSRGGGVRSEPLDDGDGEFPRVDERRRRPQAPLRLHGGDRARRQRRRFTRCSRRSEDTTSSAARPRRARFGRGNGAGEPLFVAAPRRVPTEDDGYVLALVYDQTRNASEFVILDARDIAGEPVRADVRSRTACRTASTATGSRPPPES